MDSHDRWKIEVLKCSQQASFAKFLRFTKKKDNLDFKVLASNVLSHFYKFPKRSKIGIAED